MDNNNNMNNNKKDAKTAYRPYGYAKSKNQNKKLLKWLQIVQSE